MSDIKTLSAEPFKANSVYPKGGVKLPTVKLIKKIVQNHIGSKPYAFTIGAYKGIANNIKAN